MKTETTRETAEKIAAEHIGSASYYAEQRRFCADAIEAALDAERERAAKVLEDRILALKSVTIPTTYNTWAQLDLADLAAKIRGSKE